MFVDVPLPPPGERQPVRRPVARTMGTSWVVVGVLSRRPRLIRCHWSDLLQRTIPCLKLRSLCIGCKGSMPLKLDDVGFFCGLMQANLIVQGGRPAKRRTVEVVYMVPGRVVREIQQTTEVGEYWRGVTLAFRKTEAYASAPVAWEFRSRVLPEEVPDEWDMGPDLEHMWAQHIPRQEGTGPVRPRDPGEEG